MMKYLVLVVTLLFPVVSNSQEEDKLVECMALSNSGKTVKVWYSGHPKTIDVFNKTILVCNKNTGELCILSYCKTATKESVPEEAVIGDRGDKL